MVTILANMHRDRSYGSAPTYTQFNASENPATCASISYCRVTPRFFATEICVPSPRMRSFAVGT